jgi:hypothetical protein
MGACVSLWQVFYACETWRNAPAAAHLSAAVRDRRAAATGLLVSGVQGAGLGDSLPTSYGPHGFGRGCARLALWAGRTPSRGLHAPLVRLWR